MSKNGFELKNFEILKFTSAIIKTKKRFIRQLASSSVSVQLKSTVLSENSDSFTKNTLSAQLQANTQIGVQDLILSDSIQSDDQSSETRNQKSKF